MGTVRMTGCPPSLKVMPLIPLLVQLHSLMAGGDGFAFSTRCAKGIEGAALGPGIAMVPVLETWTHDVNLSVPLVPRQ